MLAPDHPLDRAYRQTSTYWEMAYGMAKHGIVNTDYLLENTGEGMLLYAKVEPFLAEHGLDRLEPYLDPKGKFTRSLAGRGLPRTYILNPEGQIVARYVGAAEWDAPDLVAAVRDLAR